MRKIIDKWSRPPSKFTLDCVKLTETAKNPGATYQTLPVSMLNIKVHANELENMKHLIPAVKHGGGEVMIPTAGPECLCIQM